jgi:hypothetical protein
MRVGVGSLRTIPTAPLDTNPRLHRPKAQQMNPIAQAIFAGPGQQVGSDCAEQGRRTGCEAEVPSSLHGN